MMQAAVAARLGRDPLHFDATARPALPAHDHLGAARADSDGAGRARGRAAPRRASSRRARTREGHARPAQPDRRPLAGAERRRRDPRRGEARARSCCSARTSTRGTSAPALSTTASTARSSSRWPGRSPRARSPKRTIRFVLFTSEEIGLLGSLRLRRARTGASSTGTSPSSSTTSATARSSATSPTAGPTSRRRAARRSWRRSPAWGADAAERRGDPRHRQLRLPPRGRSEPRRQPGDGAIPRRLPRGVRHVRQGGSRVGAHATRRSRRWPSSESPTRRCASGPRQTRAEIARSSRRRAGSTAR